MNNKFRISVVMATYNGEKYIKEQIDSILNQTYPIFELIIQDDCSTDSTPAIAEEYAQRFPQIKFFRNKTQQGVSRNFKTAVMHATGDFIALSDQDDVWYAEKLEKQIKAIGNCDLCYSQHHRGKDREHVTTVSYKCAPERQLFSAIVGHSLLMRSPYAQNSDNWKDYLPFHDISLSLMAHLSNGVTQVEEPLNWHRTHSEQASRPDTTVHNGIPADKGKETWQPYIYGYKRLRNISRKEIFKRYFTEIEQRSRQNNPLVNKLCKLLLKADTASLISLCFICAKHRKTIYPTETKGLTGVTRGFFFPMIWAYHNDYFDRAIV